MDTQWMAEGACGNTDRAVFFPQTSDGIEQARAVCRTCRVSEACLAFALEQKFVTGIWGGQTADERMSRSVRLQAPARGADRVDASSSAVARTSGSPRLIT